MGSFRLSIALCILLGLRGVGIAWTVLATLAQYRALDVAGAWPLRVVLYGAWGVWFWRVAWGLYRRQPWAGRAFVPSVLFWALFEVGWFALYTQATYDQRRLPFVVVTSAMVVGFAWWMRWRFKRRVLWIEQKKNR